ncbi:MAG: sensor histidine kinase [Brevibacterium sp.]
MKTVITWLWLLPLPLTFAFEVLNGSGWLLVVADLFALGTALPILLRTQTAIARGQVRPLGLLSLAALALLLALIPVALSTTLSLTVMWLSLVAVVMLARSFDSPWQLLLLILLCVSNIAVPLLLPGDGLTLAFAASTVIVAGLSLGLLLRMIDRSLSERQATAAEAERRRMATELHDLVAHEVTGIVVLSQAAARSDDAQVLRSALGKIEESGTRALDEIRSLVSSTAEGPGARSPLASGPQSLIDRVSEFGGHATLDLDLDPTLAEAVPAPVWPVLDRVLAEALTNVRRHPGALVPVSVRLSSTAPADSADSRQLVLTVANDPGPGGIGTGGGRGLNGLRERLGHLGGTLQVGPAPEGGWVLESRIPWDPTAD